MKNRLIELFKQIQPDFTELFLVSPQSLATRRLFYFGVIIVITADPVSGEDVLEDHY